MPPHVQIQGKNSMPSVIKIRHKRDNGNDFVLASANRPARSLGESGIDCLLAAYGGFRISALISHLKTRCLTRPVTYSTDGLLILTTEPPMDAQGLVPFHGLKAVIFKGGAISVALCRAVDRWKEPDRDVTRSPSRPLPSRPWSRPRLKPKRSSCPSPAF